MTHNSATGPARTVLVVDDEEPIRRSLNVYFRMAGWSVTLAATQAEGIELLADSPSVALIDVRLMKGSGVEVARAAFQRLPPVPVVIMTGQAEIKECAELVDLGVRYLVSKPFDPPALLDTLARAASEPMTVMDALFVDQVGKTPMKDVLRSGRLHMLVEALKRTNGNRAAAAILLGVKRQAVQQMIQQYLPENYDLSQEPRPSFRETLEEDD